MRSVCTMRSTLVKQLVEIAAKPHTLLLSVKKAPWRRTFPLPSLQRVEDALSFVFKLNWSKLQTTHCVESVCAISIREHSIKDDSTTQFLTRLCNCITDNTVALSSIATSCYDKIIPLAVKQQLLQESRMMLEHVISRGTPLSAVLENCLVEISGDKLQPLLDAIQQMQSVNSKPSRPLFRRALKLCLHHQDQDKMAPVMAKLVTSMLECYSREEVVADVYCSALESASHEEQFENIWHDIMKSGLSQSSVTLVQSYLKGSVKLCDTNAAKMLKHLSLILKAHTLHGINLVVETAAGASEQDTHDTLTMNIFQSILLVHGIALSLKSYQFLVEQLLGVASNPIRRPSGTRLCYHLLGGLLHTYDHMPPTAVLMETSKPLVIMKGTDGFVEMFRLTKMAVGNEQCTSGLKGHWTKATSSHLVELASNTDVTLGVKVMEEMLKLGLMPNSQSILKLVQQWKAGSIKGIEYELLKCILQLYWYPPGQRHLIANMLHSLLYRICVQDLQLVPPKRTRAVSRRVLSVASNKLLQTAHPTHEHCIDQLQALL